MDWLRDLVLPGTNWCGTGCCGYDPQRYNTCATGTLDSACRLHDHCRAVYDLHGIAHFTDCACDHELYQNARDNVLVTSVYGPESLWPCLDPRGQLRMGPSRYDNATRTNTTYVSLPGEKCDMDKLDCNMCDNATRWGWETLLGWAPSPGRRR